MALIDEEECKRRIGVATAELHREIDKLRGSVTNAEFEAEVSRWAVVGMTLSRIRVTIDESASALRQVKDAMTFAEALGRNAAQHLLDGARLAFRDHAELARLRHHIFYLENHARSRGVAFKPFEEPPIDRDNMMPERWDWPRYTRDLKPPRDSSLAIGNES